ncbi:MAG: PEGA domain-containing protein, partial [Pseudomonadota bacterium]
ELRAGDRYRVVAPSAVRAVLNREAQRQAVGKTASRETAELIGRLVESDLVVTSSIARTGDEWVFTLELVDARTSGVNNRQSVSYLGEPSGLVELVRPYVARLVDGTKAEEYRGQLEILVNEEEAQVRLDEIDLGLAPVRPVGDLTIGRHRVSVLKDGYLPFTQDVVIQRNETTLLQAPSRAAAQTAAGGAARSQ